jgi:hypothetical protein
MQTKPSTSPWSPHRTPLCPPPPFLLHAPRVGTSRGVRLRRGERIRHDAHRHEAATHSYVEEREYDMIHVGRSECNYALQHPLSSPYSTCQCENVAAAMQCASWRWSKQPHKSLIACAPHVSDRRRVLVYPCNGLNNSAPVESNGERSKKPTSMNSSRTMSPSRRRPSNAVPGRRSGRRIYLISKGKSGREKEARGGKREEGRESAGARGKIH